MNRRLAILLLLAVASLITGCASRPRAISMPVPPAWVPPTAAKTTFTAVEVRLAIMAINPAALVDTSDATFTVVDHEWLERMVTWSDTFLRITGHGYTSESFDCDKFAKAFTVGVEWVAGDAGVRAQPLVARIYVQQVHTFGGVVGFAANPSTGPPPGHALVGFYSTRGIFVLEPQPGTALRLVPLDKYPNRITNVKLGG